MSKVKGDFLSKRTDISKYLVHLTKDFHNRPAKQNLISILREKRIKAYNHHCVFSPKLREENEDIQKRFEVSCFTETPLDKIHLLTNIPNRKINLEPYGLVFRKEDLITFFANPAFYVYGENKSLINYLYNQFDEYLCKFKNNKEDTNFNQLGSITNIVKTKHDFYWEREWRIRGEFEFSENLIFAVIAPQNEHEEIRQAIGEEWIKFCPFLDMNWNMEEMIEALSFYMWDLYKLAPYL